MLAQAMSKSGFGKCLGIVVCAYLFLCGPTTLAKSQSLSELTEMAAYVAELNDMTAQVSRIFEETSGYDDLATGILEKQITQSYGSRQARKLSASLLRKLLPIIKDFEDFRPLPSNVTNKDQRRTMGNIRKLLTEAIEMTESEIHEGEKLVNSISLDNISDHTSIFLRSISRYIGLIDRQSGLIEIQMSNTEDGSLNEHHYGSMLAEYKAIGSALETVINLSKATQMEHEKIIEISKGQIQIYLDNGFRHIRKGRLEIQNTLPRLKKWNPNASEKIEFKRLLILAMKSYPQTFDVEEDIMSTVEGYILDLYSHGFQLDNKSIDEFQLKIGILEQKRAELVIFRQKIIGGMK